MMTKTPRPPLFFYRSNTSAPTIEHTGIQSVLFTLDTRAILWWAYGGPTIEHNRIQLVIFTVDKVTQVWASVGTTRGNSQAHTRQTTQGYYYH